MPAGISSQYGFLYQRYAFIKTVLDNIGMDRFFVYEGVDDIDISEVDGIMSITVPNNTFIQVKSGIISKDCWAKVLGNWLLTVESNSAYQVILENELPFDINDEETLSSICDYFLAGKTMRSTSIAHKVYKKYLDGKDSPEDGFKAIILNLVKKVSCIVLPLETLKTDIEVSFKNVYCQDIVIFDMAKACRFERFIEYVKSDIDASLEKKKSYTLRYQSFVNIINRVTAEISDHKYTINTSEMRKRKKAEAEKLLTDDDIREIRQLRMVNDNNGFIVGELVKELLYKDFRNVYSEVGNTLISNMEDIAHSNFEDVLFTLPENPEARLVFFETVKREIPSSIIDNSPIYRNGCYVYLTGEEVGDEMQITWGHEDE